MALKRTPWPIREEGEEEGQVVHQIAKGISKRIVGGAEEGGGLRREEEGAVVVSELSREEGAW